MTAVEAASMILVGVFALVVVVTRDPLHQVVALGPFSVALIVLFTVLQAPDVVLSAIVVGVFAYPIMVLLTLAKVRVVEENDQTPPDPTSMERRQHGSRPPRRAASRS
jgi:uncharacterized MnhB-related membrane protein